MVLEYWLADSNVGASVEAAGRSRKTNGIVIEAKCAPAEGENFSGKKQAGAKLNMPA
jgi:hypothetical protein